MVKEKSKTFRVESVTRNILNELELKLTLVMAGQI